VQRRERLLNTLRGKPVDRPAFNFYEINGLDQDPDDTSPFNIYADPSWGSLIALARDKTDRTPRRDVPLSPASDCPLEALTTHQQSVQHGSMLTTTRIRCRDRDLVCRTRRDPDLDTIWTVEHLLKDAGDLEAYLALPLPKLAEPLDLAPILAAEQTLGDSGLLMLELADPLCRAAELFSMADYLVVAFTERALFCRLVERFAQVLYPRVDAVAKTLPGRLWRIFGAEYASPPYLPPSLFREYWTAFTSPIVHMIQQHGGYARIHSHGRLRAILEDIVATGCVALDPIEPPPQGDVELAEVRARYGPSVALFGNLEASDIETLSRPAFAEKVKRALDEGTRGEGRGFVLMPSASPYGRKLTPLAMGNYECMSEIVEAL
jgi:hypothetical protein